MAHAPLLFGHADLDDGSVRTFNHDLATAYADAYAKSGTIERLDLATLSFDPVLRAGYRRPQPLEPDLSAARDAIERANHLVWVFPTYWASPPAVVRGFVDRMFLPGWAFRFEGHALPTGLLAPRSARVIMTMDSPAWWYTVAQHRCIHRSFGTGTLRFAGLRPVAWTPIYGARALSTEGRARKLKLVAAAAQKDLRLTK